MGVTVAKLRFQPDRNALLSESLDWNKRFEQWRQSFPGSEDMFVVVDPGPAEAADHTDRVSVARDFVDELGAQLTKESDIESVVWGFTPTPRMLWLAPVDEFEAAVEQLSPAPLLKESATPGDLIANAVQGGVGSPDDADSPRLIASLDQLGSLIAAIGHVLAAPADNRPEFGSMVMGAGSSGAGRQYLTTHNGRLLLLRITPRRDPGAISAFAGPIKTIRDRISEVSGSYPGIDVGLTGIDVIESDETDAATRDSAIASAAASILIAILLVTAFHSWRVPLLAMLALLVGIAWSFGFLTLSIGHLQVLSVVFMVILLGLGIDFGVHLASHLERVRPSHDDTPEGFAAALASSFDAAGPGIITGAITTAAAFGTTMLTDFRGVAEMGQIAAVGILLCLISMFSVFPALLRLMHWRRDAVSAVGSRRVEVYRDRWVLPFVRCPFVTVGLTAVLVGVSVWAASGMRFDYDLMKLHPRGSASVHWQQRIIDDGGQTIWSAIVVCDDVAHAREIKGRLETLPLVSRVGGVGLLFDQDGDRQAKQDAVEPLRWVLGGSATDPPAPGAREATVDREAAGPQDQSLVGQLIATRSSVQAVVRSGAATAVRERVTALTKEIDRVVADIRKMDQVVRDTQLRQLQAEYDQWRDRTANRVAAIIDVSPLGPDDLPAELVRPYVGASGPLAGKLALEVFPRLPDDGSVDGPLDPGFLPKFILQLEREAPGVTGVIVQIYRSGHLIQHAYKMAGLYALMAVFVLVWIDFHSVRDAVLTLAPVAIGFAVTFGVMRACGMSVNPANIIVLPLMFGIGVDAGVHMLHRYRQHRHDAPPGLSHGTGKGITVTSLATIIGFGAMSFARHRGIADLGLVMALGVGLTLLACLIVLPAMLTLRNRWAR